MIKVAVYKSNWKFIEDREPDFLLTLKEFENKYDNDDEIRYDIYAIRFIVA